MSGERVSAQEILDFVHFAGCELTRDQLVRLHQRRLIAAPETHYPGGRRGLETTYPIGTAERVLRIVQLKEDVKKFDEIAWRLWWEGYHVESDLVRDYLIKMAKRWDARKREIDRNIDFYRGDEDPPDGRVRIDEVMFGERLPAPLGTIRGRFGKHADEYLDVVNLLLSLTKGDLGVPTNDEVDLWRRAIGWSPPLTGDPSVDELMGPDNLMLIQSVATRSFEDLAVTISDEALAGTRSMTVLVSGFITQLGDMLKGTLGRTGSGFDLAASALAKALAEPEGQAQTLLLFSSLYEQPGVRENLPVIEEQARKLNSVTYRDYERLRYLMEAVPGFDKVLTPYQMKMSLMSEDGQARLTKKIRKFRDLHAEELDAAISARPDLFAEEEVT